MEQENKQILITPDITIIDIQSAFSGIYKYLKIDFFIPGGDEASYRKKPDHNAMLKIFQVSSSHTLNVSPNTSVAEVIQILSNLLTLEVRILRKCGKVWTTISITDNWTLKSQNKAGEFICSVMASDTNQIS